MFCLPLRNAAGKYFLQQSNWPYNTQHKMITYYLFHHHGDAFSTVYTQMPVDLTVNHLPAIISTMTEVEVTAQPQCSDSFICKRRELLALVKAQAQPCPYPLHSNCPVITF